MKKDEFMIVMAFRYALGRMSTAPAHVCMWLKRNWNILSPNTQQLIVRELDEEFKRDDYMRYKVKKTKSLFDHFPLGQSIDRATWDELRKFIKEK